MDNKAVITVKIFGSEYTIKGVAEPDYIYSLAAFLNEKMAEIQDATGLKDEKKIAILAAINICDELFDTRKSTKENYVSKDHLQAIRNRVEDLIAKVDRETPPELTEIPEQDAPPPVAEPEEEEPTKKEPIESPDEEKPTE